MGLSPILAAQQGTVDKEALLGRLLWYSVPTATCLEPKMVGTELKDLGFTRRIPGIPSESNVFRRVTTHAERHKVPVPGRTDVFENALVRSLDKGNTLIRHVVIETVDPNGRRLEYVQPVDIEFKYDTTVSPNVGVMKVAWINGYSPLTHPLADHVVQEIKSEFSRWKGMFHDAIMRHWIKQTIIDMGATSVRPTGGIYFLEEKYAGQVEALESFITKHFPPGGECHSVEIPDTAKQREMVRRAIEAETTGAVEAMMAEVAELKASGKLTSKRYLEINLRVKNIRKKMEDYGKLLQRDMSAINSRVEILAGMTKGLSVTAKEG